MLDALVLDGTVTLVALAALGIELAVILAFERRRSRIANLLANLLSGLFLILALRAALLQQGSGAVALFLGLAGAAHLFDVVIRLRRNG